MAAEMLSLRRAGPSDAAAIAGLAERAYAKWVPVLGRPPTPMFADYDVLLANHRIDFHEVEGAAVASIATRSEKDHLFIETVAVDPDWQGRGLGRALLAHAEALARQAGFSEVRLLTNALMQANAALYVRTGYSLNRTEDDPAFGRILHFGKRLD